MQRSVILKGTAFWVPHSVKESVAGADARERIGMLLKSTRQHLEERQKQTVQAVARYLE